MNTKAAKTPAKAQTKTATPTHAHYAEKAVPPLILEFCAWLEAETGVPVDARSVYLGSALRGTFQKSPGNQKRIADAAVLAQAERVAKVERAAQRRATAGKRKATPSSATSASETQASAPRVRKTSAGAQQATKAAEPLASPAKSRRRPAKPEAAA